MRTLRIQNGGCRGHTLSQWAGAGNDRCSAVETNTTYSTAALIEKGDLELLGVNISFLYWEHAKQPLIPMIIFPFSPSLWCAHP